MSTSTRTACSQGRVFAPSVLRNLTASFDLVVGLVCHGYPQSWVSLTFVYNLVVLGDQPLGGQSPAIGLKLTMFVEVTSEKLFYIKDIDAMT